MNILYQEWCVLYIYIMQKNFPLQAIYLAHLPKSCPHHSHSYSIVLGVLGLGDSSYSVTIVIVIFTIMTVIDTCKNYYCDSGRVVMGMCIWHCLSSIYPQQLESTCKKIARNEIDHDKELKIFLLEGSKSDVWEYLVSLAQVENAQNLYQILGSLSW